MPTTKERYIANCASRTSSSVVCPFCRFHGSLFRDHGRLWQKKAIPLSGFSPRSVRGTPGPQNVDDRYVRDLGVSCGRVGG